MTLDFIAIIKHALSLPVRFACYGGVNGTVETLGHPSEKRWDLNPLLYYRETLFEQRLKPMQTVLDRSTIEIMKVYCSN